jgi:hypothetical protein
MKVVQFVLGMVGIALIVFFSLFGQKLLAADKVQRVEEECRAVLEQNFGATTNEDWEALKDTLSKDVGSAEQVAEFQEEAEKMFEDTDVYLRLVDFKIISLRGSMAEAMVIQMTLPKDEADREPVRHARLGVNFKHHSALLPEFEVVKYRQRFRYENGKWKVHIIVGKPIPTDQKELPDSLPRPAEKNDCPNGNCQWPRVKAASFR